MVFLNNLIDLII